MRKRCIFFLWTSALLFAGLTSCRQYCYQAYPFRLGQTDLQQNVEKALSSKAISPGEIAYDAWWNFFQDDQLSHLIELGLSCHPSIALAEARIRRACHEAKIARSTLFPHLFAQAEIEPEKISKFGVGFFPGAPEAFTEITLKLTSSIYELDIWKKNRSLFFAALDRLQANIADFEESKLLLSTAIASVYFDLQMTCLRQKLNKERLEIREELYALLKQQFDAGIISEFRLYEVDTEVQFLRDLIYVLDARIAQDKHALSALVGNPASMCGEKGELLTAPSAKFDNPFPLPCSLPIDLLKRRPDVIASLWLIQAAGFNVKVAKANFFPRIDLLGWIGFQSIFLKELFTGGAWIVGGEALSTLPLYTAGKLQGELGVARSDMEIAIDAYNQAILRAVQEVSDALTDLTIADEREETISRSIRDASELMRLTKEKYDSGIANKLTLLNALENLYVQQETHLQIQLTRFEAAVDLIQAIGGGYYDSQYL
jgi:NodT family efflux transporter outer membrane factor (OMF) lipoprotein